MIEVLLVLVVGWFVLLAGLWGLTQAAKGVAEMWRMHSPSGKRAEARRKELAKHYHSIDWDTDD